MLPSSGCRSETSPESATAVHLPGGNRFHDIRIDVAESIRRQEDYLARGRKRQVRCPAAANYARLLRYKALSLLNLWQPLVDLAVIRPWFDEFSDYWTRCLEARGIDVMEFHQLRFLFRQQFQKSCELSWENSADHLRNWQRPENFFSTLQFVYRSACRPVRSGAVFRLLKPDMRILEYGCSIAPMYRMWRELKSHVATSWVLADIPNFPLHYARHVYARDAEAEFCVITEELFSNPLRNVTGSFDCIIVQEVFEHLDQPRFIAEYLLNRLKPGGLFVFDYVSTDSTGLDTPAGMKQRLETLTYLDKNLRIIHGELAVSERPLRLCIGRKIR